MKVDTHGSYDRERYGNLNTTPRITLILLLLCNGILSIFKISIIKIHNKDALELKVKNIN